MPAPLDVDWNAAKQLYNDGIPLKEIARKCFIPFATLRQKAKRANWKQDNVDVSRAVTRAVTHAVAECHADLTKDLIKRGEAWKQRVLSLADRHLMALERRKPEKLRLSDLDTLSRIAERTDSLARKSLNLDEPAQRQTLVVNVGRVGATNPLTLPATTDEVIDVEPEPPTTNPS